MQERENLLKILKEAKEAVAKEDAVKLKELSNRTIHTASIYKDTDNVTLAVIVYSLSKVIERKYHEASKQCDLFCRGASLAIGKAIAALEKNDGEGFRKSLEGIIQSISKLSGDLKQDIKDVFRKASINKASKIYEHGISMEQTAKLLGITQWELANYAGERGVAEEPTGKTQTTRSRIKLAMEMFG